MTTDDPEQRSEEEKITASGSLDAVVDVLSTAEPLFYVVAGVVRVVGLVLGGLLRLLP